MNELEELIHAMGAMPNCAVLPTRGLPLVRPRERLPEDLEHFYRLCGGVELFVDTDYSTTVVTPQEFRRANPVIVGGDYPNDISDSWYILADDGGGQVVTIDCAPQRLGRCYDSFWDRHGVSGSCPIIARSFTEFLRLFVGSRGRDLYWLDPEWKPYGDAYARMG